jgi:hypothetical protein
VHHYHPPAGIEIVGTVIVYLETLVELEILVDSSFFGCIFFVFEALDTISIKKGVSTSWA